MRRLLPAIWVPLLPDFTAYWRKKILIFAKDRGGRSLVYLLNSFQSQQSQASKLYPVLSSTHLIWQRFVF
jgi:hypothetical protein